MEADEKVIQVTCDADIVEARLAARKMAEHLGFSGTELVVIATAVSEMARNILEYAKTGEVVVFPIQNSGRSGLEVIARDSGPGIQDLELAMQDGFSTGRGLGLGLPGTRRLMDEFDVVSKVGSGTTVTLKKWRR